MLWGVTLVVTPLCVADETGDAPRRRPAWGIYQIYWQSAQYEARLRSELAPLASLPQYVMFYRDLRGGFPKKGIDAIAAVGATPIVSLELWTWHDTETRFLPQLNAGEFDDHFRRWAEAAKRDGRRVLLRFGFEFNGDWFSWGGDPERFVDAWRRVRRIFNDVGAKNVEWVWAANITSHPTGPENDMHRYYPGDEWVEWVAIDGYNWGDNYKPWHRWTSFADLFKDILSDFTKRYPAKRLMIAESGCPEGSIGQKAAWIRASYEAARRWPHLEAIVWFNLDKRREGELNFRLDSSPSALRAFNDTYAAPPTPPKSAPGQGR